MGISQDERQMRESLIFHSLQSGPPVEHLPPPRETEQLAPHLGQKELSVLAPTYFYTSLGCHQFPPSHLSLHLPSQIFQCKPLLFILLVFWVGDQKYSLFSPTILFQCNWKTIVSNQFRFEEEIAEFQFWFLCPLFLKLTWLWHTQSNMFANVNCTNAN